MSVEAKTDSTATPVRPRGMLGRVLKWVAGSTLFLTLLLVVFPLLVVAWVLATESGLNASWHVAQRFFPDTLQVDQVQGVWLKQVKVTNLRYRDDYDELQLQQAEWSWSPAELLQGIIHVRSITLRDLRVTQHALRPAPTKPAEAKPIRLPALPTLLIDRFDLTSLVRQPIAPSQPQRINRLSFTAAHRSGDVEISEFEIDAPEVGTVDLASKMHLERTDVAIHALDIQLRDTATRLQAKGRIDFSKATPVFDLDASWTALRWPLSGERLADSKSGSITVSGSTEAINAQLDAALANGRVKGKATVRLPTSPEQVPRFDAQAHLEKLEWPLRSETPQVRLARADFTIAGTADDYRLDLDADVAPASAPPGRIRTRGQGSRQQFVMESLTANTLEGKVTGLGRVTWAPELSADLKLTLAGINPEALDARWPGKVNGDVSLQVRSIAEEPVVIVETATLSGRLRERELKADIRGRFAASQSTISRAVVSMGATRLTASGKVADKVALEWALNSTDLDSVWPGLRGGLSADGRVSGSRTSPRLLARASGKDVGYRDLRLSRLDVNAAVDLADREPMTVRIDVEDGYSGTTRINSVKFALDGRHANHQLSWSADTSEATVRGSAKGAFNRRLSRWAFTLLEADLTPVSFPGWKLTAPVNGAWTPSSFELQRACWSSRDSDLCAAASRSAQKLSADLDISSLPYGYFSYLLPVGVKLSGMVDGKGQLRIKNGQIEVAELDLQGTAGQLVHKQRRAEEITLDFDESRAGLHFVERAWVADARLGLPEGGGVSFEARIAPGGSPVNQRALNANLSADVRDLSFVAMFLREMTAVNGALHGDMKIKGTLQKPSFDGVLKISDGMVSLASPGIDVDNIQLNIIGDGNGVVALDASARSGEGKVALTGQANLVSKPFRASATLVGQDFQVANVREVSAWASPNLNLKMVDRRLDLTGEVVIPRADITPKQLASGGAESATRDQVIIIPGENDAEGVDIYSQVRITLGEAVRFEGFGLKTRIAGSIEALDRPGQLTTANGELRLVDGTYKAYGQDLDIRRGKLLFKGGPVTEPGLDILAVRQPNPDVEVGVQVRGRLEAPEFRLYSEPGMPESEQLSWLVLGRALERGEGSNSENTALANAALSLGLKGGKLLAGNFQEKLGIDSIEVGSTSAAPDQAALIIGKYLSPKLYVSYGIGLFEPSYTFRLRYELSRAFTFITESGTQSSGDIVYTFEH